MTNTPYIAVTPEERANALAEALAEGFLYLTEHDLLDEFLKPEAGSDTA
ncbi:MAG: hypothetical protein GX410_08330 [Elusimicrobia bacterium]|nr:hypothetical protein [Elusimicrobiota bacterium]